MFTTVAVRTRIVAVALIALLAALASAGAIYLWLLESALTTTARSYAAAQATTIAHALVGRAAPDVVTSRPGGGTGDIYLQILRADGSVLATSDPTAAQPIADLSQVGASSTAPNSSGASSTALNSSGPSGSGASSTAPNSSEPRTIRVSRLAGLDDDPFLLAFQPATVQGGEAVTVVVAVPIHVEEGQRARSVFVVAAAAAGLLAIATLLVRWAVTASLAPVEHMRRQLEGIDGRTLDERVDVPSTGDELAKVATTMNHLLDRVEATDRAQRAFVSDASHELRSPLATLQANLDLAQGDPTGASWAASQATMRAEIERLRRLVEDLLTLSKSDAGVLTLRRTDVDLDDLVLAEARATTRPGGIRLDLALEPVRLHADVDRLTQIVRNLLDNAATHARTAVRVEVRVEDGLALVLVANDGPLVPDEDREAIFERFVRLDDSRARDRGGSGLGLAIADDLARVHEGGLTCGADPAGWCLFELALPR